MPDTCPTLRRDGDQIVILDQTRLPWRETFVRLDSLEAAAAAIRDMQVRGAPLIGATAAFGVALALRHDASDAALRAADASLRATRPTAVNLHWALDRMQAALLPLPASERSAAAWAAAEAIRAGDAAANAAIGRHGLAMLLDLAAGRSGPLQVMTHCNAGWLATCGHGTALAPIYAAHAAGLAIHVWVSETRPRNQGLLTAWELARAGVPHTLMADNAAGWLMAEGRVDCVIVGADRIAANGDTANKVGTYLKALAASAHGVPFYIAAPRSTIDFDCPSGIDIPIEERSADEIRIVSGLTDDGDTARIHLAPAHAAACNPAFDVTPAGLLWGIIGEFGILPPDGLAAAASLAGH
ncbi:MAG: S-methyl-5-thioribose-1-phosphate isomerase [Zoogloea sp.]|uniref:S-methyl-5-thioribose-1-phosphate isomerase n=1 Tax=Zoogloea sp. TaxID=49181 RepID=UPI00261D1A14|nr:S-methyl-5-thioribose-1-phosphate isomerase [Zoogloea sp.]MDD3328095.1 S-methyl-5-thioribose-1-phosphate isomerase [Zoogloea sp.]